jgi:hypothetical protein
VFQKHLLLTKYVIVLTSEDYKDIKINTVDGFMYKNKAKLPNQKYISAFFHDNEEY